jgi:redox-sensing transcriptional repressor
MKKELPIPTITRLCMVFQLCDELILHGQASISSTGMGKRLGVAAHTLRKDLNCLGEIGNTGSGYDVAKLRFHLAENLGFSQLRRACIVGLGRLGSALLEYDRFVPSGFTIVAGFDANVNRIETIKTDIQVYPAYEMADVVRREAIELALITVPGPAAQGVADLLMDAGIRGIVNFAPVVIETGAFDVEVRNMNVVNEMRILASLMTLNPG